jgi:large subunit ribosomal protein L18e
MAKRTGPTNMHMRSLITELRKTKVPIWKDVAEKLAAPRRKRVAVNVGEINLYVKEGESVVVPGIVLSNGVLDKPVNIAAWRFSLAAVEKIHNAKGEALTIKELLKKNPKGSKIRIMV